ncbi:gliding motility-associated-like protein [Oceanihabitans sediminis]|uniref:PKD domain-containing protein n=1 Tax=Oceanihabitans sediminis TaxID=1812012 RepID=A0A368P5R9_9FLAO|nr:PKD domain-containing protein [Oceanihabitans sediminis]RBP28444.1 gliding motility-associated-like protein [Oceanihabitans sediminis]RCU56641.1 PKD domain-containing protein [Oceanihabitans sediminis]
MRYRSYIYTGVIFFIVVSSAIAFNRIHVVAENLIAPPTVSFSYNNNVCSGETVSFNSTVTGDGPFEYLWDFGDGATSTEEDPEYIYEAFGCGTQTFDVTLEVTDDNGETTTLTETVTVNEEPDINFIDLNPGIAGPFNNCGNTGTSSEFLVEVGNNSSSSCISTYNISWGDNQIDNNVSFPITHNYVGFGTYNMTITAIGDNGCTSTKTYVVKNATNPSGGISGPGDTQNLCAPSTPIQFEITNWGTNTSDTTYEVDYGDGVTVNYTQDELVSSAYYNATDPSSSLPFPIQPHSYTESSCPGEYVAKLWIRNACSPNPNPATLPNILIIISPDVSFNAPDTGCVDTTILFNNTTEPGYGFNCSSDVNFIWDFGDGTDTILTSDFQSVSHVYSSPGTYTVTLTGDNFSCDESVYTQEICIEAPLNPEFTSTTNESCAPFTTVLNNTTVVTDQCGVPVFEWDIDYTPSYCGTTSGYNYINGTDANSESPEIEFINPGTYIVSLKGTNSCGTTSSVPQEIIVTAPPQVSINNIADLCDASSVIMPTADVASCGPSSGTYTWSINTGASPTDWEFVNGTNANSEFPEISFYTSNTYVLSLEVSNSCGTSIDTEEFLISSVPTITNTDLTQTICSGATTTEIAILADDSNATFNWSSNNPSGLTGYIPNGTSSTIPAQTIINTSTTSVTLTYTVTAAIGECDGTPVDFEIIVEPAPLIISQPQSNSVCENGVADDLFVDIDGTGTPNYQWYENSVDNTNSGTAITGATSSTFTPTTDTVGTTYYYVVITFSTGGCSEIISDTAEIIVANAPQIETQLLSMQNICVGGQSEVLSVEVSGGAGVASYQWYTNTSNSNTGGTLISGATASTYTPPAFTSVGTFFYYVVVSYASSGCGNLSSAVAEVEVVNDPIITSEPIDFQSLCQNTAAQDLEVAASGGIGTLSYQWYENTVNNTNSGTPITGATSASFTPPTSDVGTMYYYCVVSQDVSGCEAISVISEVAVSAGAQFVSQPVSDVLCLGETTSDLTVSYSNGAGTPTYQWYQNTVNETTSGTVITGATSDSYTPDVSTVETFYYYVIISFDSGGCSEIISDTAEIVVNETPSVSDTSILICSGNTFEYLPDTSNGDSVPVSTEYTWTAPVINPVGSISGTSEQATPVSTISQFLENTTTNPATVTYSVTPISGNCVGDSFEVVVTVNPSISVASVISNNTCFASNNASIEITVTGGVPFTGASPYSITWEGPNGFSSTDEDIFNLEAGTYTLTILDDGGCPYSETFTIAEPDELAFSSINFDPETISCFEANDGSIDINIVGGTLPYSYTWTLDGMPFSTDEDLVNIGPGVYEVTVTDANNCGPIVESFTVVEPPLLEATLNSSTNVLCYGDATGAIDIDVVGGRPDYTFLWTGPDGFTSTSQNIDNLMAGTYTVQVMDSSGCVDTEEFIISQNDAIVIDYVTTEIACYGDNDATITINDISGGIPPYSISWSNFATGMELTDLSAGIYTLTVTDAVDCVQEFPIEIEEAPLFLIEPELTQMSCAGENDARIVLNFQGGMDPITVVWDDDPTAGVERNNLAPGTYTVTITDGTPCVIQESFTIYNILPLQLSANVSHAFDCDDPNSGSINLLIQGGTPPFSVVWSNGATTEDLDNVPPNTYVAHVTDANGCEIDGSWTVNRFEPLALSVDTQTEVDCDTHTVSQTFVAVASGGVPPFQYNWSSGTISGMNNEFMTTDVNGLVVLEVTDSLGCSIDYSFNVETPMIGDPDFDVDSFSYSNYGVYSIQDPIQFTNTATGDYESVLWDFGDGSFSGEENPVHTYLQVGNYVVTQTVTYPFGCSYTKIVTLVVEKGYKLLMPNAFTANEDGVNDFFGPKYVGLKNMELRIYDTWGSLIYSEVGEDIRGWDGKIKDEEAENGNYYFTFLASTFYDEVIEVNGTFVLIK